MYVLPVQTVVANACHKYIVIVPIIMHQHLVIVLWKLFDSCFCTIITPILLSTLTNKQYRRSVGNVTQNKQCTMGVQ